MTAYRQLTAGDLQRIRGEVFAKHDIFRLDRRALARAYVRRLFERSDATEAELEKAYRDAGISDSLPEGSDAFWAFVAEQDLYLEADPAEKLVELTRRVQKDLRAIAENLEYIASEKEALALKGQRGDRLTPEERYYEHQLAYYEQRNTAARDEIIVFVTNGITAHAQRQASRRPKWLGMVSALLGAMPYAFDADHRGSMWDTYDVRCLDEFSNKFTDVPLPNYEVIIREIKQSPEKFKEIATAYIQGKPGVLRSVREKLTDLVAKSHILATRTTVIETMLKHYEAEDYLSFVSMAPMQIEGIFADICLEIGVSEKELDKSSLNSKLDHINRSSMIFLFFEYYAFKFPVLRNRVAHGGLVDGDLEDTAVKLMLDLLPVCELAASEELPTRKALTVLREAARGDRKKLLEWIEIERSVRIPPFYDVKDDTQRVLVHLESDAFWEGLSGDLKKLDDPEKVKKSKPVKIAGLLKSSGIASARAERFLKTSHRVVVDAAAERTARLASFREKLGIGTSTPPTPPT